MTLEAVGRFDVGPPSAGEVEFRLGSLRSGVVWAVLYMLVKCPSWKDKFDNLAITLERGSMRLMRNW